MEEPPLGSFGRWGTVYALGENPQGMQGSSPATNFLFPYFYLRNTSRNKTEERIEMDEILIELG